MRLSGTFGWELSRQLAELCMAGEVSTFDLSLRREKNGTETLVVEAIFDSGTAVIREVPEPP